MVTVWAGRPKCSAIINEHFVSLVDCVASQLIVFKVAHKQLDPTSVAEQQNELDPARVWGDLADMRGRLRVCRTSVIFQES